MNSKWSGTFHVFYAAKLFKQNVFLTSIALVIYVELQPLTLLKVFKYMCSIVNLKVLNNTFYRTAMGKCFWN